MAIIKQSMFLKTVFMSLVFCLVEFSFIVKIYKCLFEMEI